MSVSAALVVAAGRGARFGGDVPKQYRHLAGRPLLRRALAPFVAHPDVVHVRVVFHPGDRDLYAAATAGLPVLDPVPGGETRQDSARLGLESLAGLAPDLVLIHDAARPFVSEGLISRVIGALARAPGAVPAVAVRDTLKRSDAAGEEVTETVDRDGLWRAQTPQGFRYPDILAAHRRLAGARYTDDATVAEMAGLGVAIVPGDEDNVKVTTADELARGERLLAGRAETRTGFGFDVHRFRPGDRLMLCGVAVPAHAALEGHSDADAALHALTDALLGAIGAGDIGQHFPPSDPRWRGAASEVFLKHARDMVTGAGGAIVNVDITVICENPRIGPHRDAMRRRVAEILGIESARVSVKGTTTERLGFTGRGEGIAAQALVTVRLEADALSGSLAAFP